MGFDTKTNDEKNINLGYYITAHETAHQWWGHQLQPAKKIGMQLVSEGLAQYSSYQVIKHNLDRKQAMILLKTYQDSYFKYLASLSLIGGNKNVLKSAEVSDQYLYYMKAIISFAQISYMIGEENVNQALVELLRDFPAGASELVDSDDLIDALLRNTEFKYKGSIRNTFTRFLQYENEILSATVNTLDNGTFEVKAKVQSLVFNVSDRNPKTERLIGYPIEMGVFKENPNKSKLAWNDNQLSNQRIEMYKGEAQNATFIENGVFEVSFILDERPQWIVIDPEYLYMDRNLKNNVYELTH